MLHERFDTLMSYIVLDLEWNQAMSSKSSIFNKLPIHLSGEIIQIGAVKLNEELVPSEEFQADVKPVYFRRMHYKVKKLTGFDKERLSLGRSFTEVFEDFRTWCGPDAVFITWGYDDRRIMEQNIIIHDLDWDWIGRWINLQLIYNIQTGGDKNQKALSAAMEHFGIEQTRMAHDALGDAYNTALVCSRLDLESGLVQYEDAAKLLATRLPEEKRAEGMTEALEHRVFQGYTERAAAFEDKALTQPPCPVCAAEMETSRWINQGDRRYMTMACCPEHGKYLVRIKFRKSEECTWSVNRIVYQADKEMEDFYREKATQSRRRGRKSRHRRRGAKSG
jgi:inhibitor of KinA sporulation pathway (predicted exonuclease)